MFPRQPGKGNLLGAKRTALQHYGEKSCRLLHYKLTVMLKAKIGGEH